MRVVFIGSAGLSCPSLEALMASEAIEVAAVVTQPDRPRGRRLRTAPCIAKALAESRGVRVLTPARASDPEFVAEVAAIGPDIIVVVAYGQILRTTLLAIPPLGCVNIHASLLPCYRGAAPVQWAIARGETVTGVTSMYMNEGMDEGDIILQAEVPIAAGETAGELESRLADEGSRLLLCTLAALQSGTAPRRPQDADDATYAPKLTKQDGHVDWTSSAGTICDRVRGFNPWPVCWCCMPGAGVGQRSPHLRVLKARAEDAAGVPGTVLAADGDGPLVAAGSGAVRLLEVQPEGRRAMPADAYQRGHGLRAGEKLE